jgi:hypothetical protein
MVRASLGFLWPEAVGAWLGLVRYALAQVASGPVGFGGSSNGSVSLGVVWCRRASVRRGRLGKATALHGVIR